MLAQLHEQLHEERRHSKSNKGGNGKAAVAVGPGQQRRFLIVGGRVGFPKPETNAEEETTTSAAQ
jgi:hypothetical protein